MQTNPAQRTQLPGRATGQSRNLILGILAVVAIGVSGFAIYRTQFAAAKINVVLHQAVGRVMAEETARLANSNGTVVVIAMELGAVPELAAQLREFERTLEGFPRLKLKKSYKLETDDQPKYSFGSGLSGRRFVRIVNKNPDADTFVSFVGAPVLSADDRSQLKAPPKLLAEARSTDKLRKSFAQKLLNVAIVSRFQFPTPVKGAPRGSQEWFDQRFQIVRADTAGELPGGKEE